MNWFTPALALITQYLLFFRSQVGDALTTPSQHLHRLRIDSTRFLHKVVNIFWSPPTLPPPTPTASCFIGSQKCMFTSDHHIYIPGPSSLLTLSLGSTVDIGANGPPAPTPASKALDTNANAFNVQSPQQVDIRIYIGIVVWLLTMILGFVLVFARMGSAHARETPKIRRRRRSTSALGTGTRPNGGSNRSFFSAFSRPTAQLPYSGMVYEQAIVATRVYPILPAHSDIVRMYEQAIAATSVDLAFTAHSGMVYEQNIVATRVYPAFPAHSDIVHMYEQAIAATSVDLAFTAHSGMIYEQAIAVTRVYPVFSAHSGIVHMYEQAITAPRVDPAFTAHSDMAYEQTIVATRMYPTFLAHSDIMHGQAIAATRVDLAFTAHSDMAYEQTIVATRMYPAFLAHSDIVHGQAIAATRVYPVFPAHSDIVRMYEQAIAATSVDLAFTAHSGMVYEQNIVATRVYPAFPAHSDMVHMYGQAIAATRVDPTFTAHSGMVYEQAIVATRVCPAFPAHSDIVRMYEQPIIAARVDPTFATHSDIVHGQAIAATRAAPAVTAPTCTGDTTRGTGISVSLSTLRRSIRVIQEMERRRRVSIGSRQQEDDSPNPLLVAFTTLLEQQQTTSENLTVSWDTRSGLLCVDNGSTNTVSNVDVGTNLHCASLRESAETVSETASNVDHKSNDKSPLRIPTNALAASELFTIDPALIPLPSDDDGLCCIIENASPPDFVENSGLSDLIGFASASTSLKDVPSGDQASFFYPSLQHQDEVEDKQDVSKTKITLLIDPASVPLPEPLDDELAEASDSQRSENGSESDSSGVTSEVFTTHDNAHDVNETSITSTILDIGLSSHSSKLSKALEIYNPASYPLPGSEVDELETDRKMTFAIDPTSVPLPKPLDDELTEAMDSQRSETGSESDASGAMSEVFTTHDNAQDVNETSITSTILNIGLSSHSSKLYTALGIYNPASYPLPGSEVDELETDRKMGFAIDPTSVLLPEPLDDDLAEALDTQRSETGPESDASGAMSEVFTRHDAHSVNETCAVSTVLDTGLSSYASGPFVAFGEYNHAFEPTLIPLPEPSADELAIEPADIPLPEDNSGFEFVFDSTLHDSSIAVDIARCPPTVVIRPVSLDEDEDAKLLFAASVPLPEPTADEVAFDDLVLPSSGDTSDVIAHDIRYSILIASSCTDQAREVQSEGASLYQVPEVSTPSTELAAYAAEVEDPSNDTEGTGDLTPIATVGSIYVDCLTSEFEEDENLVVPMGMSTSIYSCRSAESEQSEESFKSMFDDELSIDATPQRGLDDSFDLPATADKEVNEEIKKDRRWTFKTTPEYDNAIDTSLSVTQMFGASTLPKDAAVDAAEIGGPSKGSEGTGDMTADLTYHSLHVASLFPEVEEDEHIVIPLGTSMSIYSYHSPEQSREIFKSIPDNALSINTTPREDQDDTFELLAAAIEEVDAEINEERHWAFKTFPEYDSAIDPILATIPEPSEDELATDSADVPLSEGGSGLEVERLIFDLDACYSSASNNIVGPLSSLEEDEDALLPYAASFPLLEPSVDEWAIDYSDLSPPKGESYIVADNVQDSILLIAPFRAAQTEEEGVQSPHATSHSLAQVFRASTPSMTAEVDATESRRPSNAAEAAGDLTSLPTDHSLVVAGLSSIFEEDEHVVFPLGTSMSISSYRSYDYPAEPSEESFRVTFDDEVSFDADQQEDSNGSFELPVPVDEGSVENKTMPYPRSEPHQPILEPILEEDETEQEDEVVEEEDEMTGNYSVDEWAEIERQEEEEEMSNLLRDSLRSKKTNLLAILPPEMKTPQKIAAFLRFASKTSEGSSERRPSVNGSANSSSTEGTLSPRTPTRGTPDFGSDTTTPDSSPLRSRFFRKESNKGSRWISPFKYRSRHRAATGSQTPSPL